MASAPELRQVFERAETRIWAGSNGHKDRVITLAWNGDGSKLASGSCDQSARVWDVDQRQFNQGMCTVLQGHTASVDQLCWDPTDLNMLVTVSCDKSVRIWDIRKPNPAHTLVTLGENINVTWSPDGRNIAVGSKEDIMAMIDVRKGKVMKMQKFNHEVNELKWDNTGRFLFLTTELGTIEVYSTPELRRLRTVQAHTCGIYCIEFDRSGRLFAVGSADAIVSVFSLPEMICIKTFTRLEYPVRTLSFSHDSAVLAAASEAHVIDLSHVESGMPIHHLNTSAPVNTVAWHPRQLVLAYAGDDKDKHGKEHDGSIRIVHRSA